MSDIASQRIILHRIIDSLPLSLRRQTEGLPHCSLFLTTMFDDPGLQRVTDLYQKSERDGILYSRRDTMAELVMVDPLIGASKYIWMVAPIEMMSQKLKAIHDEGYKLHDSINLCLNKVAIDGPEAS